MTKLTDLLKVTAWEWERDKINDIKNAREKKNMKK